MISVSQLIKIMATTQIKKDLDLFTRLTQQHMRIYLLQYYFYWYVTERNCMVFLFFFWLYYFYKIEDNFDYFLVW